MKINKKMAIIGIIAVGLIIIITVIIGISSLNAKNNDIVANAVTNGKNTFENSQEDNKKTTTAVTKKTERLAPKAATIVKEKKKDDKKTTDSTNKTGKAVEETKKQEETQSQESEPKESEENIVKTLQEYLSLSEEEKEAFRNTFSSYEAFKEWYNKIVNEY